jgi:hypothetical protein
MPAMITNWLTIAMVTTGLRDLAHPSVRRIDRTYPAYRQPSR